MAPLLAGAVVCVARFSGGTTPQRFQRRKVPFARLCYEAPMGYPLQLSLRYMNSRKGAFISVGTAFAIVGVALGVAALAIVMSVTGGFQKEFRDKVLGVNA